VNGHDVLYPLHARRLAWRRRAARALSYFAAAVAIVGGTWLACETWAPRYDFPPQQWTLVDELRAWR
jgi:hypothetical protein